MVAQRRLGAFVTAQCRLIIVKLENVIANVLVTAGIPFTTATSHSPLTPDPPTPTMSSVGR
jgi:hypothetical protein